jgi:hypothetical protein
MEGGNVYVASGAAAILVSTFLQIMKNSEVFPWVNRNTGRLNTILSIIAAGLSTIGISYSFDYSVETGAFTLGVAGNFWDLMHWLGHWITQWAAQHSVYKAFIVPAEVLGEMRAILKDSLLAQAPQVKAEVPPTIPPGPGTAPLEPPKPARSR